MSFFGAQTFLVDPTTVAGASEVHLSRVKLYFKAVPSATVNKSGIQYPGCNIFVVPTDSTGTPILDSLDTAPFARAEYNQIQPSSDATVSTDFVFPNLNSLVTGKKYAIVVSFDGDEDFALWTSVQGDILLGSANTPSPGVSGQYVGDWFDYISSAPASNGNSIANSGIAGSANAATTPSTNSTYTLSNWRPLSTTDLKFGIYVARFTINGSANLTPIATANSLVPSSAVIVVPSGNVSVNSSSGVVTFYIPSSRYEYVSYDYRVSAIGGFRAGERAFQHRPLYPNELTPANVSVTNSSSVVTASSNVNFSTIWAGNQPIPEYIIIVSKNHNGGNTIHNVRQVKSLDSNGQITLTEPVTFTNSAANFYKAPVAIVDGIFPTKVAGRRTNMLVLRDSNANSSCRFVNNSIRSVSVTAGGTSYTNGDLVIFTGYEQVTGKVIGGYAANAVVATNATGGIVSVNLANAGAGFTNSAAIVITYANSTGGNSLGTGATLSINVGSTIASEYGYLPNTDGYVRNWSLLNPSIGDVMLQSNISNPQGTFVGTYMRLPYFRVNDTATLSGYSYYLDDSDSQNDIVSVTPNNPTHYPFVKSRILTSWSNELVIPFFTSGVSSNGAGTSGTLNPVQTLTSNSSGVLVQAASNNDFTAARPSPVQVQFFRYQVNNDYTLEETNTGNASAKGITNKVNFANGTAAEDIRVYVTAWKPANTDLKIYAKVHNAQDVEPFDNKAWTLLQIVSGDGLFSSQTDESDEIELTYGFPQWPNTNFTFTGTVTTSANSTTITGSNTTFSTSNVAVGDLVRIYNPLFSNTNHQVVMVTAITNNTTMTVDQPITNNNVLGSGLKLDHIAYQRQVFNNIVNDNVARYYATGGAQFDTFDTMQVKIVFLASDSNIVPKVDNIRVVGVSA